MDTYAYDHGLPCRNPNCKSHGHPHPNCQCYGGGGEGDYAKGGVVNYCASGMPHMPSCEYYAEGGEVDDDHHIATHHGLLGLLTNAGHAKMAEPEKHKKLIDEAKSHFSRLQDPIDGLEEPRKTMGVRLASHLAEGNHEGASDLMKDHPLVGSVGNNNLKSIMTKLGPQIMSQEADPEALRSAVDHLHGAMKGKNRLEEQAGSMLGAKDSKPLKPDMDAREALKGHLNEMQLNPSKMLDIGGNLGHYLPQSAINIAATAATAKDYLGALKPQSQQNAPLDQIEPPSKMADAMYDRQVDIAQQPLLILQHLKSGTLQPLDLKTVQTIYPKLHQAIVKKAADALLQAKTDKTEIPYKQKQSLSLLLGQPLDSTMTPMAMQAIMHAQGPQQVQQQMKKQPKKATGVELKQINKVNAMAQTPLEARQVDKKS